VGFVNGNIAYFFISAHNPTDVTKWSGTAYSIFDALFEDSANNSSNMTYIGRALTLFDFLERLVNKIFRQLGNRIYRRYSTIYAIITGAYLTILFLFIGKGPVLAIAASNHLACIITKRKIIYVSDATFWGICDLYPEFKSLPKWSKTQGHRNELITLKISLFSVYSSQWARESCAFIL
jgi:hypothetical protein